MSAPGTAGAPLLITPGMGIGPEVCLNALADRPGLWPGVVLLGRARALHAAGRDLPLERVETPRPSPRGIALFEPPDEPEPLEVAAIRLAVAECLAGRAHALVTGPIHKARLAARGFAHMGHTDLLGELCGARPAMAFVGGRFGVALVTVHLPLARVPAAIQRDEVLRVGLLAARAWQEQLGRARPRIAVCGLNPHAGEGGLLGREEIEEIGPAVEELRARGWAVQGPVSAETAMMAGARGELDLVVAMYHDQGLAPLKALDFGRTVNWTLGLPILRTSVDHGTADELVGTGRADPSSMGAAIELALRLRRTSGGQVGAGER